MSFGQRFKVFISGNSLLLHSTHHKLDANYFFGHKINFELIYSVKCYSAAAQSKIHKISQ